MTAQQIENHCFKVYKINTTVASALKKFLYNKYRVGFVGDILNRLGK